jgi:membrane-associated phospholipid phosphatase
MKILFVCITTLNLLFCNAQKIVMDTTIKSQIPVNKVVLQNTTKLKCKALIIPASFIMYGIIAHGNNGLKQLDKSTQASIARNHLGYKTTVDNYLQFAPAISVYALNAVGIKGKNNFRDRTMIYALSTIISTGIVTPLKHITKVVRPDGLSNNSFPSGHTTTAFANAEFLRLEYKKLSPWYGIIGYAMATTTGILRVYNNRHWDSDVIAGAGFGILSTKLAYWVYPTIKRKLFKNKPMNAMLMPYYQSGSGGVAFVYNFRK